jgi:hypothetical protein
MIDKQERGALLKAVASVIREYIAPAIASLSSLSGRMDALEMDALKQQLRAIPQGKDGKDADPEQMRAAIVIEVAKAVEAIPRPKDGAPGKDADPIDVQAVISDVLRQIPMPKDGRDANPEEIRSAVAAEVAVAVSALPKPKDGLPGKDAEPIHPDTVVRMVAEEVRRVVREIPPPKDGRDGTNGTDIQIDQVRELVSAEVARVVSGIPAPKDGLNGKDASPEQIREMVAVELARAIDTLPPAPRGEKGDPGIQGEPGISGKDASPEQVREMVAAELARAVAELPKAKDGLPGLDGKDAEPIHPDSIARLVADEVAKAIMALPPPKEGRDGRDGVAKDGRDGTPGRDAAQIDVLPAIDSAKRYPRGTFARHAGGMIHAFRDTDPIADSLDKAGWQVVLDGIAGKEIQQSADNPRVFTMQFRLTSGLLDADVFSMPAMLYKGIYRAHEEYVFADCVTSGGSTWYCQVAKTTSAPNEHAPSDWKLIVKKGSDGKPGAPGLPGKEGPPGKGGFKY